MDADTYQQLAGRTLIAAPDGTYTDEQLMLVWTVIGLAGEAGEVAELVKKGVFHQHGVDREKLVKELGDVLWYVAGVCSVIGVPLNEVMALNIEKLIARYPEGYSSAASQSRKE